jgi:hypothetical protein
VSGFNVWNLESTFQTSFRTFRQVIFVQKNKTLMIYVNSSCFSVLQDAEQESIIFMFPIKDLWLETDLTIVPAFKYP